MTARAPLWVARSRFEWATTLLRLGGIDDRGRACSLLDQVRATAADHGLAGLESRVDRVA
jgi:hypothetical protein